MTSHMMNFNFEEDNSNMGSGPLRNEHRSFEAGISNGGRYESPSKKYALDLLVAGSPNRFPKPVSLPVDTKDTVIEKLESRINEIKEQREKFLFENSEKVTEMNNLKDKLDDLGNEINVLRDVINTKEKELSTVGPETEAEKNERSSSERLSLQNAKNKYEELKLEYNNLVIPDRIDPPKRNASKGDKEKYDNYEQNRENIRTRKNVLSNQIRSKEIEVENAEKVLSAVLSGPGKKEILTKELKNLRSKYDNLVKDLNKTANAYRETLILKSKIDKFDEDLRSNVNSKLAYERRGLSVCTIKGVLNYDNNGNLVKKVDLTEMYKELQKLEDNPPMVKERGVDLFKKIEHDSLVEYYKNRSELIEPYGKSVNYFNKDDSDNEWIISSLNELKEVKKKIATLKKEMYNDQVWLEIDQEKYNQLKENIYRKYKYQPDDEYKEEKKYTMLDFLRSIGKA